MKNGRGTPLILATAVIALLLGGAGIASGGDIETNTTSAGSAVVVAQAIDTKTETDKKAAQPDTKNVPVTEVEVKAAREGSAEAGYKVSTVKNAGPWGERAILDTPYSIMVMPEELIRNTVSNNTDQLFRMSPVLQLLQPYDMNGLTRVNMRGFLVQSMKVDGIQGDYAAEGVFIENVDRIEAMTGLSGFMYGIGNVGGTLNYVTKRPTATPLYDFTVGNYGGSQYFAHADIGGPLDKKGTFGYRLNAMTQNGSTAIKDQSLNRHMLSGAFDLRPSDKLLIGVDVMNGRYKLNGRPGQWGFSSTLTRLPSVPDTTGLWASSDTFNQEDTTRIGARLTYDINNMFAVRAGYGYQTMERKYMIQSLTVTSDTKYTLNKAFVGISEVITNGGYVYLDSKFDFFGINNKVTLGFNGYTYENRTGNVNGVSPSSIGTTYTNLSLADADSADVSLPDYDYSALSMTKSNVTTNKNYVLGDDIKFNDKWSMLAGVNYTEYIVRNFNLATGGASSKYDKSRATPTFSLMYKPLSNITIYGTYIESLEQGRIVTNGTTIYTNNGTIFEPMTSEQYEIGAKVELGKVLLTAALFKIDKSNTYDQDNGNGTYTAFQNGRQVHKGLEMTVSGKVIDNLTLFGGLTLMNAEVEKSTNKLAEGKVPQGVAEQLAKLYAEYDLPFLRGLTVIGGVYYTGKSYIDVKNTQEAPSYTTADAGLRYRTKLYGCDTTFRANVANITDERYWTSNATIGAMLGAPRTFTFSATMRF